MFNPIASKNTMYALKTFRFWSKKESSKKILRALRIWVGRRLEPILDYLSLIDGKQNSVVKRFLDMVLTPNHFMLFDGWIVNMCLLGPKLKDTFELHKNIQLRYFYSENTIYIIFFLSDTKLKEKGYRAIKFFFILFTTKFELYW